METNANVLKKPWAEIIGPISAYVAFVIELTLVPLLLPAIRSQFDLTVGDLAWVFNSYGAAIAAGVLFCAYYGDALNTRRVFSVGVALFALGSLLSAAAQSFEMLVVGRVMQGFGSGVFSPLVPIILTRAAPHAPGRALILCGSIAGYIAAFTPLLYGKMFGDHSWRLAFAFIAIIAAVALALLSASQESGNTRTAGVTKRAYSKIFLNRDLMVTFAYVFCTYGCITYYFFQLPVSLSGNEIHTSNIGVALSVSWLTYSGMSTLLRNMVDRRQVRVILLIAPLLIALGLLLLDDRQGMLRVILSSILVGAALSCSNAPSTQLILRFAPTEMSAFSSSLDITFARFGGLMTVSILAGIERWHASVAVCLMCLIAAICAVSVGLRRDDAL